jgi:hypothetical protein
MFDLALPNFKWLACMSQAQVCFRYYDSKCAVGIAGSYTYDIIEYAGSSRDSCYELTDGTSLRYTSCDSSGSEANVYANSDCTGSVTQESYRLDVCETNDDDRPFIGQTYRSFKCSCAYFSPAAFSTVSASALSLALCYYSQHSDMCAHPATSATGP